MTESLRRAQGTLPNCAFTWQYGLTVVGGGVGGGRPREVTRLVRLEGFWNLINAATFRL